MEPGSAAAPRGSLVLKVHDPILFERRGFFGISNLNFGRVGLILLAVVSVWTDHPERTNALLVCALVTLADIFARDRARCGTHVRHIVVDESQVTWPFAHGDETLPRSSVRFVIQLDADAPRASLATRLQVKLPRLVHSIPLSWIENLIHPKLRDAYFPDTPENREHMREGARPVERLDVEKLRERLSADEVIVPRDSSAKLPTWAMWVAALCISAPVLWWLEDYARHFAIPVLMTLQATDTFDGLTRWARRLWTRWNVRRAQATATSSALR